MSLRHRTTRSAVAVLALVLVGAPLPALAAASATPAPASKAVVPGKAAVPGRAAVPGTAVVPGTATTRATATSSALPQPTATSQAVPSPLPTSWRRGTDAVDDRASADAGGSVVVPVLANDRGTEGTQVRVVSAPAGVRASVAADGALRVEVRREVADRQAAVVYALVRDGRDVDLATLTLAIAPVPPPAVVTASPTPSRTAEPGPTPAPSASPSPTAPPTDATSSPEPRAGAGATGQDEPTAVPTPTPTPTPTPGTTTVPDGEPAAGPETAPASPALDLRVVLGTAAASVPELTTSTRVPELAVVVARDPVAIRTPLSSRVTFDVRSEDDVVAGTTVEAVGTPAHGRAAKADDLVVYDPADGFVGEDTFTVTMSDGSTVTVAVTVLQWGRPPVALDDDAVTVAGRPVTLRVLANDRAVDGTTPTLVAGPADGTVQAAADRALTYTPRNGFTGTDRFTYEVRTSHGRAQAVVVITVLPRVTAAVDHVVVTPGDTVEVDVLANDAGGAGLHVFVPDLPAPLDGTVDVVGDRVLYDAPLLAGAAREVVVRYVVTADAAGTQVLSSSVVRFQVQQLGAPLAVDDEFVLEHRPDGTYVLDVVANDRLTPSTRLTVQPVAGSCPAGLPCGVRAPGPVTLRTDLPPGSTLTFRYLLDLPPRPPSGPVVNLLAAPGQPATVRVTILGSDTRLLAAQDDRAQVLLGDTVTVDVLANDLRPSWYGARLVSGPLPPAVLPEGRLTWTAPTELAAVGPVTFTYRLVDLSPQISVAGLQVGASPTATVTIDVRRPVAEDDVVRHDVGPGGDVVRVDVLANDDAPQDARAVLRGTTDATIEDGRVLHVPLTGRGAGTYTFEYALVHVTEDDAGGEVEVEYDSAVVTVEVRQATAVDDAFTVVPGETVDLPVLRNDRGTADRVLQVPDGQDVGGTVVAQDRVLTYTMDEDFDGTSVSFDYVVSVFRPSTDYYPEDRATVTITRATPPSAPQRVTARGRERAADVTWAAPASDGGLPVTGYRVRWGVPGEQEPQVRDLPADARSTSITGLRDAQVYEISVTALNRAGESEPGRTSVVPPTRPSAPRDLAAAGGPSLVVLSWRPPADDGGLPRTGYRVTWVPRTSGGAAAPTPAGTQLLPPTATSTVVPGLPDVLHDFTVVAENDLGAGPPAVVPARPQARPTAPDRAFTTADTAVTVPVLANDGDVAGLVLGVLPPTSGTASVEGDLVRWTPAGPFDSVTLDYVLSFAGVEVVRGTAVVHEVRAVDDLAVSPRGRPVPLDVLANDLVPAGVVARVTDGRGGVLVLGTDGRFTPGTPVVAGPATAVYELVADGRVVDTATVTVEVGAAPRAVDDTATTPAGEAVRIPVLDNDVAAAGLTVAVLDPEDHDVAVAGDGVVTYRPPLSASGVVSFRYALRDAVEAYSTATVRVTVTPPATRSPTPSPRTERPDPGGPDPGGPDPEPTDGTDDDRSTTSTSTTAPPPTSAPPVTPTPPSPSPTASPSVRPEEPTLRPGALVRLSGGGCEPGERVPLQVDGRAAGSTTADEAGRFAAELPGPTSVGRHELLASCSGREFSTTVDVVVTVNRSAGATGAAGGAAVVAALLSFYLLTGSVLVPRGTAGEAPDAEAGD